MNTILILGVILFAGFVLGELVMRLGLPKITGYILAGVLLNPQLVPFIPADFPDHTDNTVNIAISFIAFSIGGSLYYPEVKKLGKSILSITFFEAELGFVATVLGFLGALHFFPEIVAIPGAGMMTTFLPLSLLIGSLAGATDPSPALAVTHEYKADGEVAKTILGVAAFDDVMGIINFSVALTIAAVFAANRPLSLQTGVLEPLTEIVISFGLGILLGFLFNLINRFIREESEGVFIVLILSLLAIGFGLATLLNVDQLLVTMTMGAVVVNFCPRREVIFRTLERYTEELIFVLFFTLSSMHLDLATLPTALILIVVFTVFRMAGKFAGVTTGAFLAHSSPTVSKYTIGGLVPYGGIVLGLALLVKQNPVFGPIGGVMVNVVLGATILHELLGAITTKWALKKAGEITT